MFTDRIVLPFAEIEGIIGDNLPRRAIRDREWWKNTRFTAQGRAWMDVGWTVENVDTNNRTARLIRVATQEVEPRKKSKEKKKTEFFKRPSILTKRKKTILPSKTRIAQAQARLRNIERRKIVGTQYPSRFPKSAYEKRLFKPEAKPSKTSN